MLWCWCEKQWLRKVYLGGGGSNQTLYLHAVQAQKQPSWSQMAASTGEPLSICSFQATKWPEQQIQITPSGRTSLLIFHSSPSCCWSSPGPLATCGCLDRPLQSHLRMLWGQSKWPCDCSLRVGKWNEHNFYFKNVGGWCHCLSMRISGKNCACSRKHLLRSL